MFVLKLQCDIKRDQVSVFFSSTVASVIDWPFCFQMDVQQQLLLQHDGDDRIYVSVKSLIDRWSRAYTHLFDWLRQTSSFLAYLNWTDRVARSIYIYLLIFRSRGIEDDGRQTGWAPPVSHTLHDCVSSKSDTLLEMFSCPLMRWILSFPTAVQLL